jgi:hypothetical protein
MGAIVQKLLFKDTTYDKTMFLDDVDLRTIDVKTIEGECKTMNDYIK